MKEPKTTINLSISQKLLKKIEENVIGKTRSEKIQTCVELGYRILNGE